MEAVSYILGICPLKILVHVYNSLDLEFYQCPYTYNQTIINRFIVKSLSLLIFQKNYTTEVTEYFDSINNKGAVYNRKYGKREAWIYNFVNYELFHITGKYYVTL